MAISLRQTRLYLLKTLRVYNWLAGALAIIFLLFALYRAYLTMGTDESFSSFYNGLFPPSGAGSGRYSLSQASH